MSPHKSSVARDGAREDRRKLIEFAVQVRPLRRDLIRDFPSGGLTSQRAAPEPSPPRFALEYLALIRPIFRSDDEAGSDGIININHIKAFGLAALARSKPMVKTVCLPATRRIVRWRWKIVISSNEPMHQDRRAISPARQINEDDPASERTAQLSNRWPSATLTLRFYGPHSQPTNNSSPLCTR
jgi:hypothetical protein